MPFSSRSLWDLCRFEDERLSSGEGEREGLALFDRERERERERSERGEGDRATFGAGAEVVERWRMISKEALPILAKSKISNLFFRVLHNFESRRVGSAHPSRWWVVLIVLQLPRNLDRRGRQSNTPSELLQ